MKDFRGCSDIFVLGFSVGFGGCEAFQRFWQRISLLQNPGNITRFYGHVDSNLFLLPNFVFAVGWNVCFASKKHAVYFSILFDVFEITKQKSLSLLLLLSLRRKKQNPAIHLLLSRKKHKQATTTQPFQLRRTRAREPE